MRTMGIVLTMAAAAVLSGCNKSEPNPAVAEKPVQFKPAPKPKTRVQRAVAIQEAGGEVQLASHTEPVADSKPAQTHDLAAVIALDQTPVEVPPVLLTQAETDTCKVKVGDALPEMKLFDAEGSPRELADHYGSTLTVVAFWTSGHPYAVEELRDLQADVQAPFADQGIRVVAIDTADEAQAARDALAAVVPEYDLLFDTSGEALAQVATGTLPRTYLVDAAGKIVWFDIEYSRSTRRELQRAIRAVLQSG